MLEDGVDAGKVLFLIANVMSSIPDRSFFSQTAKISKIELPHKLIDCMSRNSACEPLFGCLSAWDSLSCPTLRKFFCNYTFSFLFLRKSK